jgi:hypothetical protein
MQAEDSKAARLDAAHDCDRAITEQHLSTEHREPVEAK